MTILIDTKDKEGLIHQVSSVLLKMNCNIQKNDEFVDKENNYFFMRTEITNSHQIPKDKIYENLKQLLPNGSNIKIYENNKKSIVILCSKEAHCLGDILIKYDTKEIDVEIKGIISNHTNLEYLAEKFNIPYFYIPHTDSNWAEATLQQCKNLNPSFIILAKYMQILPPRFVKEFNEQIINIHHSFLPAFIGANPYKQAYDRGVKMIGATAHFVNDELDCGPIICQDIIQVNHTYTWKDMQKVGKNIERIVLAKAIELAIDNRIFIHQNKTIVF